MQAGSPGSAAVSAADKTQMQQRLLQQKQPQWKHHAGVNEPLPDVNSLGSQTDLDQVQQALTQRLAKLLQQPS